MLESQKILKDIEGMAFQYLGGEDVMRHHLVQRIITAYEKATENKVN